MGSMMQQKYSEEPWDIQDFLNWSMHLNRSVISMKNQFKVMNGCNTQKFYYKMKKDKHYKIKLEIEQSSKLNIMQTVQKKRIWNDAQELSMD